MKKTAAIATILVVVSGLVGGCTKGRSKQPDVDVTAQIRQLRSPEAAARLDAARALGRVPKQAHGAIPDLIDVLHDHRFVQQGMSSGNPSLSSCGRTKIPRLGNLRPRLWAG